MKVLGFDLFLSIYQILHALTLAPLFPGGILVSLLPEGVRYQGRQVAGRDHRGTFVSGAQTHQYLRNDYDIFSIE